MVQLQASLTQLQADDGKQRERLVRIEASNSYLIEAVNRLDRTVMASFGKGNTGSVPP
jgi:hypothetical protein